MNPTKVFHIYAKEECIYNNLTEEQFTKKWAELNAMVGLLHTDYLPSDFSYEEVARYENGYGYASNASSEPPGSDSY